MRATRPAPRSTEFRTISLPEFIPAISPRYQEPAHLLPLTTALENLFGSSARICVSVPPRHGKSETLLHYIAWLLCRNPMAKILYVSHTATFAAKQSKTARRLARQGGVRLADDSNRADEWETEQGGGLVARGIDGEITGRGFDVIIVDDPIKSRKVAESSAQREAIFDWFTNDVFTRLTPIGSVVVVHTRWHVNDLIGKLVKEQDYERLNLRAIAIANDNGGADNDNGRKPGEALWPDGEWTAEVLADRRQRVGEYAWWSLYQGEPRPRGGAVFGEPTFYDELPIRGYKVGIGIDLAYTAKGQGRADWSVYLEIWKCGEFYYVVEVIRKQVEATAFALTLKARATERPGVRMHWHAAGPEKGTASFFRKRSIPVAYHQGRWRPIPTRSGVRRSVERREGHGAKPRGVRGCRVARCVHRRASGLHRSERPSRRPGGRRRFGVLALSPSNPLHTATCAQSFADELVRHKPRPFAARASPTSRACSVDAASCSTLARGYGSPPTRTKSPWCSALIAPQTPSKRTSPRRAATSSPIGQDTNAQHESSPP